ncbi:adapter protein mecA [Enterococcus moraviensis ATCC BAA-383]|uniref:Adapter protein MecA n=1 Tax=Enterococcus moraviensis ATCC BAA-383 TaxID=1158609 RepID=R2T1R8_9ENTE|nr:adaptor protein MecA [Enterococcus moraviensis]EOH98956.1 adapter protein mecA [Enterococcus moraviensis ATCC BAA-383]EOT71869.1 adapter protein mecA [Enterococcus moraviensis ATCC BAA-383]OJG67987.1 adapter protein mecA [Enterococcus moraviensis]
MEMEHINENTIRVLIGNEDLADRGITFLDLLGNHKEVENFFYSILEEVDVEDEFQGSEAVTFQVLPKSDGLELFISKNASIDEVSNFEGFNDLNSEEVSNIIRKQIEEDFADETQEFSDSTVKNLVFELNDFDTMVQLANEVFLQSVIANLYTFKGTYYLQVIFLLDELGKNDVENELAQLLEFANLSAVTPETLNEYGTCIMERNALELTRYYFE